MFNRLFAISVILCSILIAGLITRTAGAAVPMVGDRAPDFTLTSVKGDTVTLSGYRGSIVVLGLFHICVPCMNQATEMQKLLNEQKTDAVFIGVNTAGDTREDVLAYLGQFKTKITFPYLIDPAMDVNKKYFHRFMPTLIIIDEDGVIRYRASTTFSNMLLREIVKIATQ